MTTEYKCPYCKKQKDFTGNNYKNWSSVRHHTAKCLSNTNEYYIENNAGPIHYTELFNNFRYLKDKYPMLKTKTSIIRTQFRNKGFLFEDLNKYWSFEKCITKIREFYNKYNRVPGERDFVNNPDYPNFGTIIKFCGTWSNAIIAAGFRNNTSIFGHFTKALDSHTYRSKFEAEFVNSWLFNKEKYIIEPYYPDNLRMYDFYLPERDLYIELDGGIRPQVMEEKIAINKQLGRKLLVIKIQELNIFKGFD